MTGCLGSAARLTLAFFLAGLVAGHAIAQEPPAVIQGRVVQRGTATGIPGVSLELVGVARLISGANGGFRFPAIPPGRYTISVEALGYLTQDVSLIVRRDTTLVVQLDISPIPLDTIQVRTRTITLRGRVFDREYDDEVMGAEVLASGGRETETNAAGGFRIRRIPVGDTVTVLVRALGYLPLESRFVADRDTTLRFALDADPIATRMIAAQVERLEKRANAVPYMRTRINRRELLNRRAFTIPDLLRTHGLFNRTPACVFIDDIERPFGMEMLLSYLPDELERIEVIDRGTMVRVYTRRYVPKLMGKPSLTPILLIKTPGGVICK